jgi:hypothetical protein
VLLVSSWLLAVGARAMAGGMCLRALSTRRTACPVILGYLIANNYTMTAPYLPTYPSGQTPGRRARTVPTLGVSFSLLVSSSLPLCLSLSLPLASLSHPDMGGTHCPVQPSLASLTSNL